MTQTNSENSTPAQKENIFVVENNFGKFEFDRAQSLHFPAGIVGFPDMNQFGMANLPGENLDQFKLLQSLDDARLSFIVLPLMGDAIPLDKEDIDTVVNTLKINPENMAMLFIVTVRRLGEGITMTYNNRAPVVLDVVARTGQQYVIANHKYDIQQSL